jgi:predicted DNA-binding transcriptional regulator AlpA
MNYLNTLPPDLGRNRVLDSRNSAEFWSVSLPHWRRLYRAGKVPPPILIGDRKYGWRVGDLIDALAKRASEGPTRPMAGDRPPSTVVPCLVPGGDDLPCV